MMRPHRPPHAAAATVLLPMMLLFGCPSSPDETPPAVSATARPTASPSAREPAPPSAVPTATPAPRAPLRVVAGGDVSFGRATGQLLLANPERDDFAQIAPLLKSGDLRFLNLECTLSDQNGLTVHPANNLVFTGPPVAAKALSRTNIDIVSLANNHAWDFGKSALLETFDHLEAEGVAYVGAGRTREQAYGAVRIERGGYTLAFVAMTAIWNQAMVNHPGKELVADAARSEELLATVRQERADPKVDFVLVSFHGGVEYEPWPLPAHRALLRSFIDAGADAVIGHHAHVVQRVEFYRGKPILYSLGNLMMGMKVGKPWTELGAIARLTLAPGTPPAVELCPYRIWVYVPIPLAGDARRGHYQPMFEHRFRSLLRAGALESPETAAELGAFAEDGCAPVVPAPAGESR